MGFAQNGGHSINVNVQDHTHFLSYSMEGGGVAYFALMWPPPQ
jgi:hypothetical protein